MDASPRDAVSFLPVSPLLLAGPIFIGGIICYLLFGILLVEVVRYAQTAASSDQPIFRWTVVIIALCNLLQLCFIGDSAWRVLAQAYVNPKNLIILGLTSPAVAVLNGDYHHRSAILRLTYTARSSSAANLALPYLSRLYALGTKSELAGLSTAVIALLGFVQLGGAIGIAIKFAMANRDVLRMKEWRNLIVVHLAASVACDIVITLSGTLVHATANRGTAPPQKSLTNTLMRYTVENGLLLTAFATATLMVYLVQENGMVNVSLQYATAGLYANVLLINLNKRNGHRRSEEPTTLNLSDVNSVGGGSRAGPRRAELSVDPRGGPDSLQANVRSNIGGEDKDLGGPYRERGAQAKFGILASTSKGLSKGKKAIRIGSGSIDIVERTPSNEDTTILP